MAALKLLVIVCLTWLSSAQIPIPKNEVGFTYNNGRDNASVHIDAFLDLLCPYSKEAFPTLMQVADFYARGAPDAVELKVHLFPLPYHLYSFLATKGAHAVNKLTRGNETYGWIDTVYQHMAEVINPATTDKTPNQMIDMYVSFAQQMGISADQFRSLIDGDDDIEENTRIAWKYGCSRAVVGTPSFFVNNVAVNAAPTWTVDDWKKLINPVLGSSHPLYYQTISACPPNTKTCEYLPGKTECCTAGEGCIPNVGCRC